ncbi:MAG: GT4 family glycosyltransferase PelF [Deltaproteobacteria bacterium]|nr:GT4 family glycosyltransferase PelF [Deltaproteobacteria bacterium]
MKPMVADVCLILEGTYPFVTGGVSSWVHELIKGMPDLTFSLLHISASRSLAQEPRYEMPDNVVSFVECFVHDPVVHHDRCRKWTPWSQRELWRAIDAFHRAPMDHKVLPFAQMMQGSACPATRILNTADLLLSRKSWRYLVDHYKQANPGGSFIDFFWTWRAVHMPIFQILNAETPPARLYHIVSTGYAGLAGIVAKTRTGRPLLLTEHGIYVKERKIEINRADWIYTAPERVAAIKDKPSVLKRIWIDNFLVLGKLCYEYCDQIFTLYGGNQQLQLEFGAPADRLEIIPNGVKTDIFAPLRDVPRPNDGIRRVGFVGRVVPIKDVKCFIKACRLCAEHVDNVEFLILGPTDEDQQYYKECVTLVALLGMQDKIKFCGRVDVRQYYPKLDVFVLTSISEGQPLTILEAACAGVPTVSTDVGSCSELLLGRTDEDRAIGPSGIITNIGKPKETGEALVRLLADEGLRQSMIQAGYERIERYYRQDQVIETYHNIYQRWMPAADQRKAKVS